MRKQRTFTMTVSRSMSRGNREAVPVIVDVNVRERFVLIRVAPPLDARAGWFETSIFIQAVPGKKLVVPLQREIVTMVRHAVDNSHRRRRML